MHCSCRQRSASRQRARWRGGLLALLATCLLASTPAAPRAAESYAVVVSASVPVDNLSSAELRRILRLDRRYWKAGEPVVVLLPPSGSATRAFALSRVMKLGEAELRRVVLEKMYSGEIDLAPKVVASDGEAASFAASGRGVLAIVPASTPVGTGVKILRIDGHLPKEPGYPLIP